MAIKVVSPQEWLPARLDLLTKEKELTRARDALTAQRRALPMVKIEKDYRFSGPGNQKLSLADLFAGRRQLLVYHFMFGPAGDQGCSSCSFLVDHVGHLSHLNSRDTTLVVVSRAPIEKIEAFKARMGWTFPWYSSFESDFNYDFHVSQDESVAPVEYNYKSKEVLEKQGLTWMAKGEQPGMSSFYRGDNGEVYHTYSAYGRGLDHMLNTYNMLDMTVLGRQEDEKGSIVDFKHHDKYDTKE